MVSDDVLTEDLARGLPDYLPNSPYDNNYLLLYPVAQAMQDAQHGLRSVENAIDVQNAETIDQLKEHGKMLEVPPETGESIEHYRTRLLVEYSLVSSKGTINDVIEGAAEMLGVSHSDIGYEEPAQNSTENGTATVTVPGEAVSDSDLTEGEVGDFLDRMATFGARVEGLLRGTFEYISVADYNSNDHDASKGYDGLDGNGDPKDNGGTYSGLI